MPRAGKFSVHKVESISSKGGAAIVPKVKVNDGIYQTFFGFILVPVDLNDCVVVMCDDSDSDSLGIKVKERDDVAMNSLQLDSSSREILLEEFKINTRSSIPGLKPVYT